MTKSTAFDAIRLIHRLVVALRDDGHPKDERAIALLNLQAYIEDNYDESVWEAD